LLLSASSALPRKKTIFVNLSSNCLYVPWPLVGCLEAGSRPGKTVTRGNQKGGLLAAYDLIAISHLDIQKYIFSVMTSRPSNSTHANAPPTAMGGAATLMIMQRTVMTLEAVRGSNG